MLEYFIMSTSLIITVSLVASTFVAKTRISFISLFSSGVFGTILSIYLLFFAENSWIKNVVIEFNMYRLDLLVGYSSMTMVLILSTAMVSISLYSIYYLKHRRDFIDVGKYWRYLSLLFLILYFAIIVNDYILFIALLEIATVFFILLIIVEKASHRARSVARLYMVVDIIASTLLITGFMIIYLETGSTSFTSIVHSRKYIYPSIYIVTGFIIKSGLFPFHWWLPRVHGEAPPPISALASGFLASIGVYEILFLSTLAKEFINYTIVYLLLVIGLVSMLYGSSVALVQRDVKKLIAYSTIAHNGYIAFLLGLTNYIYLKQGPGASIVSPILYASILLYILGHSLAKMSLFLIAGKLEVLLGARDMYKLGGLKKYMPITYIVSIITAFSLIGLPPTVSFLAKSIVHVALLKTSLSFITDVSIAGFISLLTASYMIKFIHHVFLSELKHSRIYSVVVKHMPWEDRIALTSIIIPLVLTIAFSTQPTYLIYMVNSLVTKLGLSIDVSGYLGVYPFIVFIYSKPPLPPISMVEEVFIIVIALTTIPLSAFAGLWIWLHIEKISIILHELMDRVYRRHVLDRFYQIKTSLVDLIESFEDNYVLPLIISIALLLTLVILIIY